MTKIKSLLAILVLVVGAAGMQACAESPTASGEDGDPVCWWIRGQLICDG